MTSGRPAFLDLCCVYEVRKYCLGLFNQVLVWLSILQEYRRNGWWRLVRIDGPMTDNLIDSMQSWAVVVFDGGVLQSAFADVKLAFRASKVVLGLLVAYPCSSIS